ncbi:hypothetical protein [Methanococcus maripaludis]|uniref:Uncharacterized protein n=1 Tax=Methanococcus maripaludis TaxID=39152 RepID=A0A7J9S0U4_METMI|nr:hypothetical protein [Methanococcus maripaludis]MBB6067863.1 hypothetical protein [Methanococcus maripaludis]
MTAEIIELSLTGSGNTSLTYTLLEDCYILQGYYADVAQGTPATALSIKHTNEREYTFWSHTNDTTTESKGIIPEIVGLRLQAGDTISITKSTYSDSYGFLQLHVDNEMW